MKPSERIYEIGRKLAGDEWVNSNSVSNRFFNPEDYYSYLLGNPEFCLKTITLYLDEEYEKTLSTQSVDKK